MNHFSEYDFLYVGANGFAQAGSFNYHKKATIEMNILLEHVEKQMPVPDEFKGFAWYTIRKFPHDFGTYKEIVVIYNRMELDNLEESEEVTDNEKYDRFFNWFKKVETLDLESTVLTSQIKIAYLRSINTSKGEHLEVKTRDKEKRIS